MKEYLTMRMRNIKGAHAKPATVIPSTARYNKICGGAGPSVTTSPEQKKEKLTSSSQYPSTTKHYGYYLFRR